MLQVIKAEDVRDGEPRWWCPDDAYAARTLEWIVTGNLHTEWRREADAFTLAIVDRPAPTPPPAPGLGLDAVDQDFRAAMEGPPGNRSAIKFYHETWPALIAEVRALRRHYDAAGPDHNLLALLDLYHEREQAALAKLAEAKRLGLIAARVVLDDDTDLPAIAAALEAL